MPKLVRLYILCVITGFGLSLLFVGALVWQDVAGLRHLLLGTASGPIAGLLMIVGFGTLFAGVQFALAVMSMAEDEDGRGGSRSVRLAWRVAVPAPAPKRRS